MQFRKSSLFKVMPGWQYILNKISNYMPTSSQKGTVDFDVTALP